MTRRKKSSRVPSPGSDIRLGRLEGAIGFHLRMAQEASFAAFSRRAHRQQLKAGKYAILQLLAENPGITQTALSRASGRDKSTLTTTLRGLQTAGLIHRQSVLHDGRSAALYLTPKGTAQLRALRAHAIKHDAKLNAIVGPQRREEFLAILRAIEAKLDDAHPRRKR